MRFRNTFKLASASLLAAALFAAGCGSSQDQAPATAFKPPTPLPNKVMTKADKIAAVEKAPIPEDQKKAEIAKINAGP